VFGVYIHGLQVREVSKMWSCLDPLPNEALDIDQRLVSGQIDAWFEPSEGTQRLAEV